MHHLYFSTASKILILFLRMMTAFRDTLATDPASGTEEFAIWNCFVDKMLEPAMPG
jgi:hypothetical protein